MKLLVTGGAGFIGSHLIDNLLAEGHEITNLDNFSPFYDRSIKEGNIRKHLTYDNYRLVEATVSESETYESLRGEGYDMIIHLAAKAGVRPSIINPKGYQRTNTIGTQNIMAFAQEEGIKNVVFASSSSVYGVNPNIPWQENNHDLQPISIYAASKLGGEQIGSVYAHLYGIRFTALRFFTVYGPRQRPDLAIHKFTRAIMNGEPITMYGDGTTARDYTFVDDIIQGIRGAMAYDKSRFEIFNLGNNQTVKLAELIAGIEKATGKKAIINRAPEQPGDVPITSANIDKSKELLNYQPQTNLDDGLASFVDWYVNERQTTLTSAK